MGIVDGLSLFVAAIIIVIPLMLVPMILLDHFMAFYAAIVICMLLLFLLGLFLGTVSKKNICVYGAKTLCAGIVIASLMLLISLLTGASG